jgi:glycosyltransferase involved in cell wall biosynthesis
MPHNSSVEIVIPCYNPEANWDLIVIRTFTYLCNNLKNVYFKLTLVNDGSTSTVQDGVENLKNTIGGQFSYLNYETNMGKGYAIRYGVNHTSADHVIYTDIDCPYKLEDIVGMVKVLRSGTDVVVGVRSEKYYNSLPLSRTLVSKFVRLLLKHILQLKIPDTQCGLKGFSHKAKAIFLGTNINRFLFDMEFILQVGRNHDLKMKAYSVSLRQGVTFSRLNLRILIKEGMNFLKLYYLK